MTILIFDCAGESVRGFIRRWFIEPKPNVFVSSISSVHVKRITDFIDEKYYLQKYICITSSDSPQGFKVFEKDFRADELEFVFIDGSLLIKKLANKSLVPPS